MALTLTKTNVRPLNGALVRPFVTAGAVSLGDWVYVDSDGAVVRALADAAATAEAVGVVVSGADEHLNTSGDFVTDDTVGVCVHGPLTGFSGLTPGADLYLSGASAGGTAESAPANPAYTKVVGRALSSSLLWVGALNYPANEQTPA